jgi:hypothetical protein
MSKCMRTRVSVPTRICILFQLGNELGFIRKGMWEVPNILASGRNYPCLFFRSVPSATGMGHGRTEVEVDETLWHYWQFFLGLLLLFSARIEAEVENELVWCLSSFSALCLFVEW